MKKIIITFSAIFAFCNFSLAQDIELMDYSVDEKIKKKYNTSKIEEELLPKLPQSYYEQDIDAPAPIFDSAQIEEPTTTIQTPLENTKTTAAKVLQGNALKLKSGTKFAVKNKTIFSSSSPKGAVVTFESVYAQRFGDVTLPVGTKFKGIVTDSHRPQITGNGGLVEIQITDVILDGKTYPINAKITLANEKKVFLNSIKGERRYFKNLGITTKPTSRFMGKMWKKTCAYIDEVPAVVLAPFTFTAGVVAVTGGVVVSPFVSFFNKGKAVYFNQNTSFVIKLLDDALIL